jgi:hypothetical protein|tara:strand:+ start:63 stop:452 length:390 start_codon:yes stop_codon:yes gene_type:complete
MSNENQEGEVEQNPLHDLVQHSLDQDYNNANKVFNDIMQVKLNDVLDMEKIKLANQLYNGQSAEADDTEGDEDQLELDLDNEEDGGDVDVEAESGIEDEEAEEESDIDDEVEMEDDELLDDDTGGDEEN